MPDYRIAYRPFPEQQAYFRRKVNLPSARWDDLMHGEHAHAFMAAGVARLDVLDDLRRAVQAAIDEGEGFAAFRERVDDILRRKGWIGGAGNESEARRAWRMRTIYQTNLRASYMAGRWQGLQKFPYLRYQHNTVANPREQHRAWDGLIIAIDDAWLDINYPPNGWNCRCTMTGVSHARLKALGKTGPDSPPSGGAPTPPEWAYHPGKAARSMPAAAKLGEKVMQLPPNWRKIALEDAQTRRVDWFGDWPAFVDQVQREIAAGASRPQGASTPLGFIPAPALDTLASGQALNGRAFAPVVPQTALIATTDRAVYHSLRDAKFVDRPELREAFAAAMKDAPNWVGAADAVVWNERDRVLMFARRAKGDRYMVLVTRTDMYEGRSRQPVTATWVRTIEWYTPETLKQHALVSGKLE